MELFRDRAVSSLASDITAGATVLQLAAGEGSRFDAPTGGDFFRLVISDDTNTERNVICTARSGDNLTVARGSPAFAFSAGAAVRHTIPAASAAKLRDDTATAQATANAAGAAAVAAQSDIDAHELLTTGAHGGIVADTDPRLSDSRTPTAHATSHQPGGSDPMAVDAIAGTGSLRTLGTGAQQAAAGADSRFPSSGEKAALAGTSGTPGAGNPYVTDTDSRNTNARAPTSHATSHEPGGGDAMAVDATAGTGSLRTLGTGAQQAAAGSDTRFPTGDQKAALAGTDGAPSGSNKYVTNSDARNTNARTPAAHALVDAVHTASGLTAGHVLRATGAGAFSFQPVIRPERHSLSGRLAGLPGVVILAVNNSGHPTDGGTQQIIYSPFLVAETLTITALRLRVTVGAAGGLFRIGIYPVGSNMEPVASLVHDFGEFDATNSGNQTVSSLSVQLTPGRYYTAIGVNTVTGWQLRRCDVGLIGAGWYDCQITTGWSRIRAASGYTYGALPSTPPAITHIDEGAGAGTFHHVCYEWNLG